MGLQAALDESERLLAEAPVYGDPHALFFSGTTGTIGCTDSRLVFDDGGNTVYVPLSDVGSVEYQEPQWSRAYLYAGLAALAYGFFGNVQGLTTLGLVVGASLLATGYWLRKSELTIYTPQRRYHYVSRGSKLGEVARTFRRRRTATDAETSNAGPDHT